ncbi:MAG: alanine racemase [Rhizomicrobium sp.]|jgi:alanine racemase
MKHLDTDVASLTVRLGAVRDNFGICGSLSGTAVAGVVKADAYGLGLAPVARALLEAGCDTFFVARLSEGISLRPLAPEARIFVLDGVQPEWVSELLARRLTPVLNSLEQIETWSTAARQRHTTLDAALHFDTGMNRLGLPAEELSELADGVSRRLSGVNLVLVMSHLASADNPQSPMNVEQLARFRAGLARLPPASASLSSSGGIMLGRDYSFDLVRPGIALYGGNPQPQNPNPFKVVAVLNGRILQLRRVDKGESVGYGATFRTARPSTLATVALGYADGLMRAMGNRGAGAIAGTKVPVAGRVSMDLITLDVTDAPSLAPGADVEFLGDTITLEELAAAAQTASYEILTLLGARIPRRYVEAP